MSLLMAAQWDDCVELVSDTLVVQGDDNVPVAHALKVHPIPHLNMVMAATGTAQVARAWLAFVANHPDVRDIDDVNAFAPQKLRDIQKEVGELYGDAETSTIYLFGFPRGSDQAVSYTYTSMGGKEFESERFKGDRFVVKPGPQTFSSEAPYEVEEWIALAERIRAENLAFRDEGKPWVSIGGELWAVRIESDSIRAMRWHRFADYNKKLPAYV